MDQHLNHKLLRKLIKYSQNIILCYLQTVNSMSYTLAVISDIHGNNVALDAVLKDISEQFNEVIEFLCPGDLVGYGPDPSKVIDRIFAERKLTALSKGNHDHAVGLERDKENFDKYIVKFNHFAQQAIRYHGKILSNEEKAFLYQLPSSRTCTHKNFEPRIALIHGSPEYPLDEYILPNSPQQKSLFMFMELIEISVLLLGHTHIPFVDKMTSNDTGMEMLICNPGSIGQPRDKDPRASYAVLDIPNLSAEIIRVDYDIDLVQKRIVEVGLPEFLAERLHKGI